MEYISITKFNEKIKGIIKDAYKQTIYISGEIFNYKKSNHNIYASIRDEESSINIIKWNTSDNFKNGDKVNISGYINFYTKNSIINIIATTIELTGFGKLYKIIEDRKIEFEQKGYFEYCKKKSLPDRVNSIGIITAANGAALQDILYVLKNNKFKSKIIVKNVSVQGVKCPEEVKSAIEYFNQQKDLVDVILVTRGGGSIEDLIGFSDPLVIEAIHSSNICTISAIGHEIDFMLSDYVADIRAPTPSIAAELISKTQLDIKSKIDLFKNNIKSHKNFITKQLNNYIHIFISIKSFLINIIILNNKNSIQNLNYKFKTNITKKFDEMKLLLEKLKIKAEDYNKSRYNSLIYKDNKIIKSIDDLSDGKYKLIIADKEINIKIKIS